MERGAGGGAGERTLVPLEQLEFQLSPSDRQKNNGREAQRNRRCRWTAVDGAVPSWQPRYSAPGPPPLPSPSEAYEGIPNMQSFRR